MVDLVLLQTVSYLAGALGVCVAAFYYVMTLRETNKSRRVNFTNTLMQAFQTLEGGRIFVELANMEWSNFDDFVKKYDSKVNEDNYAKRDYYFGWCDRIGYELKAGLIDSETLYNVVGERIMLMWLKFKPIVYEYRKMGDYAKDTFSNFEYAAFEMARMKALRDPSWKGSTSEFTSKDYDEAFKR